MSEYRVYRENSKLWQCVCVCVCVCLCPWTSQFREELFRFVKDRSRRPSHHVGCSLVKWGCRQEHTTQETVASIKIALFIYNGVFVKPQNIQTQTEHTKAYTRQGTPLSIQVSSS